MSKQATNHWCEAERVISLMAVVSGMFSTKLTAACWLTFAIVLGIHMVFDRSYLKEWTDWMWPK